LRPTREQTKDAYAAYIGAGSFAPVYAMFPDVPRPSVRRLIYEHRYTLEAQAHRNAPPAPTIDIPDDDPLDAAIIWKRAVDISERKLAQPPQAAALSFPYGPVCIAFSADWHLGSEGTDYARLEDELGLIADTPGMYAGFIGDALDNFILGKLMALRMGTPFRISEEWAMVRYALEMIAPKLLFAVGGNHDAWTARAAGIDYLADVIRQVSAVPYDADELTLSLQVGAASYAIRARHKWRLNSMYNPTHGIEQASRFDKGRGFDVGVGAHTHTSGLSREFNNGGRTGIAVLAGAYKRHDDFARQVGFPGPNDATAVAVVFTEAGMWGTSNLRAAADYMAAMYRGDE
jgi:hypothetical protein